LDEIWQPDADQLPQYGRNRNRKVELQCKIKCCSVVFDVTLRHNCHKHFVVCFSKPEIVISQLLTELLTTIFPRLLIGNELLKKATSPSPKPGVKLPLSVRHLENQYNNLIVPKIARFG